MTMEGSGRRGPSTIAAAIVLVAFLLIVGPGASADPGPALVSVADVQVSEGAGTATLTVTLSQPAASDLTVGYATHDGGATQPADYTEKSGSLAFSAGETSHTVTVPITANTVPQDDRSFTFVVSLDSAVDPSVAAIDHGTATVTIVDDDWAIAPMTTSPADGKATESGGVIDFSITLNAPAPAHHAISVDYQVANGSAVLGADYTMTDSLQPSGTIVFAPGEDTKHVKITGIDDGIFGANKTFTVTLSNPVGAKLAGGADAPVTGTITEASAPPLVGISDCTGGTVNAGSDAQFLVRTSASSQLPASLHYTTVDDTTVADDYDHVTNGDVVIAPGTMQTTLTVHTKANPPSGDRSFHVVLADPQNSVLLSADASHAACTIHNAAIVTPTLGTVSIADPAPVTEPNAGAAPVDDTFTVTYHPPAAQPPDPQVVTVHWTTHDGTATSPDDYTAASGTLTWEAGAIGPQTFAVKVNPAGVPADTTQQSFTVSITATNATVVDPGTATAKILPVGTTAQQLSVADAVGTEGQGTIPVKVSLSPAGTTPVTVHYETDDDSASAGDDYVNASGTLTFAPGETTKTVPVSIINDNVPERTKTFTFVLSEPTGGASLTKSSATITILDDDALPPATPRAAPFTQPLQGPIPLPQAQPTQPAGQVAQTHLVLAGIVNGESKVTKGGKATFRISCPAVATTRCHGTIALDVRVAQKVPKGSHKKPALKTIRVGNGTFTIRTATQSPVTVTLTHAGFDVVKTFRRIRVKATVTAVDATGTKGKTAWIVSLVAPPKEPKQISVRVK